MGRIMASGDTQEIFLTGACLQEQIERVLDAQNIKKVKEIKPVLERMAKAHLELLTKRLEGSEESEEKGVGATLRQEVAPDGQVEEEFGVSASAMPGQRDSTDDEE